MTRLSLPLLPLFILLLLAGCQRDKPTVASSITAPAPPSTFIHLRKLKKLFITGDFNGDKIPDTLYQHNYSALQHCEIDSAADPYLEDWASTVINWFYQQQADVYLACTAPDTDTLHLGTGQGLYCLLNLDDNNKDGRDEIAFVVDALDQSSTNTCLIYELCGNKWQPLNEFGVNESAFDFTGDEKPVFAAIKDGLEKQNGQWVYLPYPTDGYDSPEEVGKMKPLQVGKCQ